MLQEVSLTVFLKMYISLIEIRESKNGFESGIKGKLCGGLLLWLNVLSLKYI